MATASPTVETTKDFILIKIPRRLFMGESSRPKLSLIEKGLQDSLRDAREGKIFGPYRNAASFLRALKKSR